MTTCGVPQGPCLGPLLFTLYSSKLFMIIEKYLSCVHAYADDTLLYLSFKPGCTATEEESIAAMENCIKAIRAWMILDKMKINDIQTEFLIIGMKQQLNKVNIKTLSVGDSGVAPAVMAQNLGALFDENMTLLPHINPCKLHSTVSTTLEGSENTLCQTLVHAVVIGKLDYCNSLLYGLPMKSISKLQCVQNAAARLITNTPRNDHITPVLWSLHWLPVKERMTFKILTLSFKAIHGLAPDYIQSLVTLQCPSRYSLRRNNECFLKPFGRKTWVIGPLLLLPHIFLTLCPDILQMRTVLIDSRL